METAFEIRYAGLQCFLGRSGWLLQQQVDRGACHFRYVAHTVCETKIVKPLVLLSTQAEADHPTSRFDGHENFVFLTSFLTGESNRLHLPRCFAGWYFRPSGSNVIDQEPVSRRYRRICRLCADCMHVQRSVCVLRRSCS